MLYVAVGAVSLALLLWSVFAKSRFSHIIRSVISAVLTVCGIISSAISASSFHKIESSEWAVDAFNNFTDWILVIVPTFCTVLILSVIFSKKKWKSTVILVTAVLFTVAALMFTRLFVTLANDPDFQTHLYIRSFGIGLSLTIQSVFCAYSVKEIIIDNKN